MTYDDPNDPLRRDRTVQNLPPDDSVTSNATWGWVAAAIFAVVVLFLAFTAGRENTQTASNAPPPGPAATPSTAGPPAPTTSGSGTSATPPAPAPAHP